jgi:hypothetical protein
VKTMLSLTNFSMVLSCSAVSLFSSAMAVIYQLQIQHYIQTWINFYFGAQQKIFNQLESCKLKS